MDGRRARGGGPRPLRPERASATRARRRSTAIAVSRERRAGRAARLSDAGSDWRRGASGAPRPARSCRIGSSGASSRRAAWTHDDAGFFYGRYPEPPADAAYDAPNRDMELRYHRLGTDSADDPLVFSTPEQPEWGFEPEVSDDGRLLVVTIWRGTDPENRIYVADLADGVEAAVVRPAPRRGRRPLRARRDRRRDALPPDRPRRAARPRHRRRRRRSGAGPRGHPRGATTRSSTSSLVGDRLAVAVPPPRPRTGSPSSSSTGATSVDVELPGHRHRSSSMAGRREDDGAVPDVRDVRLAVDRPRRADGRRRVARGPAAARSRGTRTTTSREQVFVTSDDGTQVPLFLTRRRDVVPNGDVPTLLYGYGGFQIAIGPRFKAEWLAWMERGGLLAVASLRGGGEYGKALARRRPAREQAERVRRLRRVRSAGWPTSGWTRPERIGISGRSNGGLLVGATHRPSIRSCSARPIAEVGVMDMLRFHRFTIGWGWTSDYGSPDDPAEFRTLLRLLAAPQHPAGRRRTRRRWSRPATTTTGSCPATRSSSRPRSRRPRRATRRSSSGSTPTPGHGDGQAGRQADRRAGRRARVPRADAGRNG